MAGVDVGDSGGGRPVNQEINMIPFIDLLMVTIAFLLITAVWATHSRLNADARVPGLNDGPIVPHRVEKVLHVHASDAEFKLVWKHGATVISETTVPRPDGKAGYRNLAEAVDKEWKQHGEHRDPSDKKPDQCVLHAANRMPFSEIVAAIDAVYEPKREMMLSGEQRRMPVFNIAFAAN